MLLLRTTCSKFYYVGLSFRNIVVVIKIYFLDRTKSYITGDPNGKTSIIFYYDSIYRSIDKVSIK